MTENKSGHFRIYRDPDFLTSDGQPVGSFYMEIPCEVVDGEIIVPSFEIPSSEKDEEVVE